MYICTGCRHIFDEPEEVYVEGTYYPEPHDRGGLVCVGGDCWENGCPYCGSTEYYSCEFDGYCPNCDAELGDIDKFDFSKQFTDITCPKCKHIVEVDRCGDICDCYENEENT